MKKLYEFLKRNEILQIMGIIFLFMGLVTAIPPLISPSSSAWFDWLFVLVPSTAVSILAGIIVSIVSFVRQRRLSRR